MHKSPHNGRRHNCSSAHIVDPRTRLVLEGILHVHMLHGTHFKLHVALHCVSTFDIVKDALIIIYQTFKICYLKKKNCYF